MLGIGNMLHEKLYLSLLNKKTTSNVKSPLKFSKLTRTLLRVVSARSGGNGVYQEFTLQKKK